MIIFRGDAEFGVEFVKFALRQPKITHSRHIVDTAALSMYQVVALSSLKLKKSVRTPEIHAVRLSGAVVGIYHDHFSRRC